MFRKSCANPARRTHRSSTRRPIASHCGAIDDSDGIATHIARRRMRAGLWIAHCRGDCFVAAPRSRVVACLKIKVGLGLEVPAFGDDR
jgi:hypothetical protein